MNARFHAHVAKKGWTDNEQWVESWFWMEFYSLLRCSAAISNLPRLTKRTKVKSELCSSSTPGFHVTFRTPNRHPPMPIVRLVPFCISCRAAKLICRNCTLLVMVGIGYVCLPRRDVRKRDITSVHVEMDMYMDSADSE